METIDLCFTPAAELDRLIQSKALSPVELVDALLQHIERLNPTLNAYLTVSTDLAHDQARKAEIRALRGERLSPIDGIPYSIKDLEPTAGVRTTYGSKWFEQHVPREDSSVVARLRAAGGVLLGKTNTSHFGYKDMCDNLLAPPCRNPWSRDRTPGASSGGAGAAVAAGLGPLAQGSDGAGSIRIPAALCGIFGLKPSYGRVPIYPYVDYFGVRTHNGPMTRTVRDAALLLQVMAGPDERDPFTIDAQPEDYIAACNGDMRGLRVAWSSDLGYVQVDPEVHALTERAAHRFRELGCRVEAPAIDWPDPRGFHKVIYEVSIAARHIQRARERPGWIEPSLMSLILNGSAISAITYHQALMARSAFYNAVRQFFDIYDLLLTPQVPIPAWPIDLENSERMQGINGAAVPDMFDRLAFTYPFNLTGQPAASVPCGFTGAGLPVALQIVGRWHADGQVLCAAACFEALQPWAQYRPTFDETINTH